LVSTYGYHNIQPYLEEKFGLHDTCGVHNLHAMPSVLGALASVIVAANRSRWFRSNENVYGSDNWDSQWWRQLVSIFVCVAFAIVSGLLTDKLLSFFSPTSMDHTNEDIHEFHDSLWWDLEMDHDAVLKKVWTNRYTGILLLKK
jgi:ammonium transporter Rh